MINGENELRENTLTSFLDIYKVQRILGSARVKIINRSIFPNTIWEKLYSCFWLIAATVSIIYYQVFYYKQYFSLNFVLYLACAFGTFAQYISYVINVVYDKFLYRAGDAEIFFLFAKVNQALKLNKCTYMTKTHVHINYFFLAVVNVPFCIGYYIHAFYSVDKPIYVLFMGFQILIIYMDILVVGYFIVFLSMRLGFLNDLLVNYITNTIPGFIEMGTSRHFTLKKILEETAIEYKKKNLNPPKFDQYYVIIRYILKCYKTITEVYSLSVLSIAAIVTIWTYIIIGTSIIAVRTQLYSLISTITVAMWAGFYFIQLTVLAYVNDIFMQEVKNTKLLCIRILSYSCDDAVMKVASKILREFKNSPPTFSVYGIFVLDTRIPVHLLSLITANIMIVIQFSY